MRATGGQIVVLLEFFLQFLIYLILWIGPDGYKGGLSGGLKKKKKEKGKQSLKNRNKTEEVVLLQGD